MNIDYSVLIIELNFTFFIFCTLLVLQALLLTRIVGAKSAWKSSLPQKEISKADVSCLTEEKAKTWRIILVEKQELGAMTTNF